MEPGVDDWLARQELDKQMDVQSKKNHSIASRATQLWNDTVKKAVVKDVFHGLLFDTDCIISFYTANVMGDLKRDFLNRFQILIQEPVDTRGPLTKMVDESFKKNEVKPKKENVKSSQKPKVPAASTDVDLIVNDILEPEQPAPVEIEVEKEDETAATWRLLKSKQGIQIHKKRMVDTEGVIEINRGIIQVPCDISRVFGV